MLTTKPLGKVKVWAIGLPVLLLLGVLMTSQRMFSLRAEAQDQVEVALAAQENVERILELRARMGEGAAAGSVAASYEGLASAMQCAARSGIASTSVSRGESTKPRKLKEGGYLHQESYKLNNITILQATKFVDHAEQDFTGTNCKELTLSHVRSQNKDIWNATVVLEYTTQ